MKLKDTRINLFFIATVVFGVVNVGLFIGLFYILMGPQDQSIELGRPQFVELSLAVLESLLALIAIGLALLGIFGYRAIHDAAEAEAKQTASDVADEQLRKMYSMHNKNEEEAEDIVQTLNEHIRRHDRSSRGQSGGIRRPTRHWRGDDGSGGTE